MRSNDGDEALYFGMAGFADDAYVNFAKFGSDRVVGDEFTYHSPVPTQQLGLSYGNEIGDESRNVAFLGKGEGAQPVPISRGHVQSGPRSHS